MKKQLLVIAVLLAVLSCLPAYAQMPNYADLTKQLVDIDGWEAQEATGMNMNGPMGEMVNAVREYEKNGALISAQIVVGGIAQSTWAPFEAGYSMESPEIVAKTMDVSGHRIGISHDKMEKTGTIVVLLNTKAKNGIFALAYEGLSHEEALDLARKFSWSGMEKVLE